MRTVGLCLNTSFSFEKPLRVLSFDFLFKRSPSTTAKVYRIRVESATKRHNRNRACGPDEKCPKKLLGQQS